MKQVQKLGTDESTPLKNEERNNVRILSPFRP